MDGPFEGGKRGRGRVHCFGSSCTSSSSVSRVLNQFNNTCCASGVALESKLVRPASTAHEVIRKAKFRVASTLTNPEKSDHRHSTVALRPTVPSSVSAPLPPSTISLLAEEVALLGWLWWRGARGYVVRWCPGRVGQGKPEINMYCFEKDEELQRGGTARRRSSAGRRRSSAGSPSGGRLLSWPS